MRVGSVIHTDEARVYQQLKNDPSYSHQSVVHKYTFVNYETGVNTQAVESYNNKVKRKIKEVLGLVDGARDLFLVEFMWRDVDSLICFYNTLNLIKF